MSREITEEMGRLLQTQVGWEPSVIGAQTLSSALKRRLNRLEAEPGAYLARLRRIPTNEAIELSEDLAVGETWFFRHEESLRALIDSYGKTRDLSLLSFGCSTGEEAYSLAILCLEAGIPNWRIYAADLLDSNLEKARAGRYQGRTLRKVASSRLKRFFTSSGDGWVVNDEVKERVYFHQANAAKPELLTGWYHGIVCRNLMLYLDQTSRKQLLLRFRTLLLKDGALLVSSVEAPVINVGGFIQPNPRIPLFHRGLHKMPTTRLAKPRRTLEDSLRAKPPKASDSSPPTTGNRSVSFDEISNMANRGQLHQALSLCHRLVDQHPTGDALALLGVLSEASGSHAEAMSFYERALEVEPTNETALLHLALAHEREGEWEIAAGLRLRLEGAP